MKHVDQIGLFEPDAPEAVAALKQHAAALHQQQSQAEIWDACLCPGARDECLRQAERHYAAALVFAIFLDLEREVA